MNEATKDFSDDDLKTFSDFIATLATAKQIELDQRIRCGLGTERGHIGQARLTLAAMAGQTGGNPLGKALRPCRPGQG